MSARDELAADWEAAYESEVPVVDFLLAAGYRKPRTITTLGMLPNEVGTVMLTGHGKVMVLMPGVASQNHWQTPDSSVWWSPMVDWLPVTVLHEGEPS